VFLFVSLKAFFSILSGQLKNQVCEKNYYVCGATAIIIILFSKIRNKKNVLLKFKDKY